MNYKLSLVECSQQYWEFVRLLRLDERVMDGFIEKMDITAEQQQTYMSKYSNCFRIALLNGKPAGYFGVIDDDIRVCVHPDFQRKGIATLLIKEAFSTLSKKYKPHHIWLNARIAANTLYTANDFKPIGMTFDIKPIGIHQRFFKIMSYES